MELVELEELGGLDDVEGLVELGELLEDEDDLDGLEEVEGLVELGGVLEVTELLELRVLPGVELRDVELGEVELLVELFDCTPPACALRIRLFELDCEFVDDVELDGAFVDGDVFEGEVLDGVLFDGDVFDGYILEGDVFDGDVLDG